MRDSVRFLLLITFLGILMLPTVGDMPTATHLDTNTPQDLISVANLDENTPWWDVNYHYRRMVNLTDSNSTPRVDVPMEVYVPFENKTCYKHSIRVVDPNGVEIPSQPYNITYWEDENYIKGATVFWYANVSSDCTATYWIYHSEDTTITATDYDPVVSFARTTGTLTTDRVKFYPNYWSFRGDWYNVSMYNAAGGKITNAAHKMDDDTWNWEWGTYAGSMHWNPDGLAGQGTSSTAPIAGTTFVNEEGPLFINYTTQLPFGSYAKLNVTYTFYKWGWTSRILIEYSATRSGSGRTDEWVFYPYITTHGVEVAEDLTQTYYDNWAQSGNKGKPAGFGWWNDNGMSHGTIRMSHDSWNTNPSYTNNYDNYYYRWYDSSSYEFWDTVIPTIYAISGTVLEETCAFSVWNGAEGIDGYMRVFNATSRFNPLAIDVGDVSSYSFKIIVTDIGDNSVEGATVSLLDASTGEQLYKAGGQPYTELTDLEGSVTFIGLQNNTYTIATWIDTSAWLNEDPTATGMNVSMSGDYTATGPFTPINITLNLASIDIHLDDFMTNNLATTGSETIQVRIYNASDVNPSNWKYMDYQTTDTAGDLTFNRVPKCEWVFNFSYSDTDTGHIYQWNDFAEYSTYQVLESDIIDDLSRSWNLPLVTLDFNVKAYDGELVPDAYIQITKKGTSDPYPLGETDSRYNTTHYTDANGNVTFYRVLNGTWNIYLYRTDNYGQTAFNNTEQLSEIQGYHYKEMIIPLTWLKVLVEDDDSNRVTGAQLDLKANGVLLVTAYTNSSGMYDFHWIKANDSSIPLVYSIFVSKAGQNVTRTVYASFDYTYINEIILQTPAFSGTYTELSCTEQFYSWKYGDNQTFVVDWYNRTTTTGSLYEDTALSDYSGGTLIFTIWHQGMIVGGGEWNSSNPYFVWHHSSSSIHFTIIIDTLQWGMEASTDPYLIKIKGITPGYDNTTIYTVTVVISAATTTPFGPTSDTQYWSDGFGATYSLQVNPVGRDAYYLTSLTYSNYTIYDSLDSVVSSGTLSNLGSGVFRFSNAILNGSDVGVYRVTIWLYKGSCVNHTLTLTLTYNPIPTTLTWSIEPSSFDWGSGTPSATLYLLDTHHGTPVSGPFTITLYWINQDTGATVLIDSSATLLYTFSNTIVNNGTWKINAYISKDNYVSDNQLSIEFTINAAPTQIVLTSSDTDTVQWGVEYGEFDFIYQLVSPVTNIPDAILFDTSWTGESELIDNGDGTYRFRILSVQEAANYTVSFSLWIANRTAATGIIYMNVLIPLEVTTDEGASQQTPVEEYFTRTFRLTVVAGDLSNQSNYVSGVIVSYTFIAGSMSGTMFENVTGKYYWIEFSGSVVAEPGVYAIQVSASRQGCTPTETTIWIEVLATPSRAYAEFNLLGGEDPPLYYGDSMYVNFSWFAEIDGGQGIPNPDLVQIALWRGLDLISVDIGGVLDLDSGYYQFFMDTMVLDMTALSSTAPTLYQIEISFSKFGFEDPPTVTIIVLVSQTPTQAIADPVDSVIWSDNLFMRVHLMDSVHSSYIWNEALVQLVFGLQVLNFTSLNNGTFILTENSADIFSASDTPYDVVIRYLLPNYLDGQISISVKIDPIQGDIFMVTAPLRDHLYNGTWTDAVSVLFQVRYSNDNSTNLPECVATYYWVGYESVGDTFSYALFFYDAEIDTSLIPAGTQILRIALILENHTISFFDITMELNPLIADLVTETVLLEVVYDSTDSISLTFELSYEGTPLTGATVSFILGGTTFQHSTEPIAGTYTFAIDPTLVFGLDAPMIYLLNFTVDLPNYVASETTIPLTLLAPTSLNFDPLISVEYGASITIYFTYWDTLNDETVSGATITAEFPDGRSLEVLEYNSTHYVVVINAADLGDIATIPYNIQITATAFGFQSYSGSETYLLHVYVNEPTYDLGPLGTYPRTTINTIALMTFGFIALVGLVASVRKMRIPYQIKQIDKALNRIEKGKTAKVENIKTMGMVISELLAPGLAEFDIDAPVIEASVEDVSDVSFDGTTEDLLGELDALDEVGKDDDSGTDFEAELEAELDSIVDEKVSIEETAIIDDEDYETFAESEPETVEETIIETEIEEEPTPESESEPEAEVETEEVIEPEPEELEAEVEFEEPELEVTETAVDAEPDVEEVEAETVIVEDEVSEEEISEQPEKKQLSKKEMIDLLPAEIREKYPDDDLGKLSKSELQELLDYIDNTKE